MGSRARVVGCSHSCLGVQVVLFLGLLLSANVLDELFGLGGSSIQSGLVCARGGSGSGGVTVRVLLLPEGLGEDRGRV